MRPSKAGDSESVQSVFESNLTEQLSWESTQIDIRISAISAPFLQPVQFSTAGCGPKIPDIAARRFDDLKMEWQRQASSPLSMNRLHFPIRGRRTSATDEDDLKDPIAALSPSSSSFVRRPSSVDGDEQHTDLCAGTHGARFMVTIHVHSLENFPPHEPTIRGADLSRRTVNAHRRPESPTAPFANHAPAD